MGKVTKNNLLKHINNIERYIKTNDKKLLYEISNYIDNIINNDKKFYHKVTSYNLSDEKINLLFTGGLK